MLSASRTPTPLASQQLPPPTVHPSMTPMLTFTITQQGCRACPSTGTHLQVLIPACQAASLTGNVHLLRDLAASTATPLAACQPLSPPILGLQPHHTLCCHSMQLQHHRVPPAHSQHLRICLGCISLQRVLHQSMGHTLPCHTLAYTLRMLHLLLSLCMPVQQDWQLQTRL